MATQESMAIRANAACNRIEALLKGMGVEVTPLPRLMRDREMLRCIQLEQIADMLEQVSVEVVPGVEAETNTDTPENIGLPPEFISGVIEPDVAPTIEQFGQDAKKIQRRQAK